MWNGVRLVCQAQEQNRRRLQDNEDIWSAAVNLWQELGTLSLQHICHISIHDPERKKRDHCEQCLGRWRNVATASPSRVAWEKQGWVPELEDGGGRGVADRTRKGLAADVWAHQTTKVRPWIFSTKRLWQRPKPKPWNGYASMKDRVRPEDCKPDSHFHSQPSPHAQVIILHMHSTLR